MLTVFTKSFIFDLRLGSKYASDDLLLLLSFSFFSGLNSCVICLSDNIVFLIGFCQKRKLLELVKCFYFTISDVPFIKVYLHFFFCVFENKIWNFANRSLSGKMIKLNGKCYFKLNMFTCLNCIIEYCWEEASQLTCRASLLAGFCSMRAVTERYFRTDYS